MQSWKRVIGTASVCLVMLNGASVALADESMIKPILAIEDPVLISAQVPLDVTGTLVYIDLEGGFYSVDGYRLIGDNDLFKLTLNQQVRVTGCLSDEMSIYMTKAIKVDTFQHVVTGVLTRVELEGGYYAVGGIRLIGEAGLFQQHVGYQVQVVGTFSDDFSVQMVKAIKVAELNLMDEGVSPELQMVQANRALPSAITWNGNQVHFSQGPLVVDGTLMIPLRDLVKAAGGRVDWSGRTKTATVEMSDRMAYFVVGETKAEMNENNVRYFQRNLLAMAKAPRQIRGHLYVSADALSNILGLLEVDGQGDTMQLGTQSGPSAPKKPADSLGSFWGSVKELGSKEQPGILVEGRILENGDPELIWALIDPATVIVFAPQAGQSREQPATVADLVVGQHVGVDMAGPMMMSYPGRVAAAKIVIEQPVVGEILTGSIKQIESGSKTRILLESGKMSNGEANLIWLTVDESTRVSWFNLNNKRLGLISDLCLGQEIQVQLAGPILESYPAQGAASLIIINKA